MIAPLRRSLAPAITAATFLIILVAPSTVLGHAELTASTPADKASVAGPFAGPITLTFSEALQSGSSASLLLGGNKIADAAVSGATMAFTPSPALAPGAYTIQWTSVAADKDVARGTLAFTVLQPTSAPATPTPVPATATPAPSVAATASAAPSVAATAAPTAVASAAPAGGAASSSGGDVILPIIVALAFVVLVGASLLRKRASS